MDCVLSDSEIQTLLFKEAPYGDITTSLLVGYCSAKVVYEAACDMTLCGVEEAARLAMLKDLQVEVHCRSGDNIKKGTKILTMSGGSDDLFMAWKVAQSLMEWMSGMASYTSELVLAADGIPIACSRKQIPFTKALSVKAIRSGGAIMHRLGFSDSLLIFSEHRQFLERTEEEIIEFLSNSAPEYRTAVEVSSIDDAKRWIRSGAEIIQLNQFSPYDVAVCRQCIHWEKHKTKLAVYSDVTLRNVSDYVSAGADILVTAAPYYAQPKKISTLFLTD
ncbi:ModD protein [Vibrio salinus]|uniref:ModD protein n=1 Tax=Vibrio salinus TaxID=2899784 RepID=UPI001E5036F6|nr:ModD protein [Vibrio salinus]MCE0495967.1 ModD protein [Vibrio salinus]